MSSYEIPFMGKAVSFLEKHMLTVYIAIIVTLTLIAVVLQMLGVHK